MVEVANQGWAIHVNVNTTLYETPTSFFDVRGFHASTKVKKHENLNAENPKQESPPSQLHGLHDSHGHLLGEDVGHDVDGVRLGLGRRRRRQQDLQQRDHILWQQR